MESAKILEHIVAAEAQGRVLQFRGLIENQRALIEESNQRGYDTISAKIIFDSLLISLSLYTQRMRHKV